MKNKKKFILLGILILIIIIVIIAFVIKKTPKQNLIYSSNGRLYLLADNKELGRGKIESIKYSHDTDIFLFKIENDLYLYKDDAIKIIENAKTVAMRRF